jgi:hypothetical protein
VDFYPVINGQMYCVEINGNPEVDMRATELASAAHNAARRLDTSRVRLGAALKNELGGEKWTLSEAQVGTQSGGPYRWTGLTETFSAQRMSCAMPNSSRRKEC